jgi:hypothetical protein
MTIKTNTKMDPKGSLKPIKKNKTMSSSLAMIIKSGGVTAGAKASKMVGITYKESKVTLNEKSEAGKANWASGSMDRQEVDSAGKDMYKDKGDGNMKGNYVMDGGVTGTRGSVVSNNNGRWDRKTESVDDHNKHCKAEDDIQKWQNEVKQRATSS